MTGRGCERTHHQLNQRHNEGSNTVPIREDACEGPCNRAARDAWDGYDQAVDAYPAQLDTYAKAYEQHLAAVAAWHPPLLDFPTEPRPPRQPEPPTIPVAIADPAWCNRCPKMIRNALYQVNDLAPVIYADITGHRGAAITGPNGSKPLDPKEVIERLDEMYGELATVASQWKQFRGHVDRPTPARGSDARNMAVAYLLEQLDRILLHPGSVDFGLGVLRWERRLLGLAKSDPVARRSPISCPRCREPQVRRRDDGYYECETCGRLLNQAEHDREFSDQAEAFEHEQQEVGA